MGVKEKSNCRLAIDDAVMMENTKGFVALQSTPTGEAVPSELMATFDGLPRNVLCQNSNKNPEEQLPRYCLHKMIAANHYPRPRKIVNKN